MILGIGTDIIAVKRMDDIHARHGGRLAAVSTSCLKGPDCGLHPARNE